MDGYNALFQDMLKKAGLSVTMPRRAVFNALYSYGLQDMSELIVRCRGADRASVYRTVTLFEDHNIATRVPHGFKYKIELSDKFLPHHHHIACSVCDKHTDIEQINLERLLNEIALAENYQLTSHKVELTGICPHCQIKPA